MKKKDAALVLCPHQTCSGEGELTYVANGLPWYRCNVCRFQFFLKEDFDAHNAKAAAKDRRDDAR